jgi:putative endonuclease
MLECADGTYYTGVTTDVERRLREHNTSPKGAKYTLARRPVTLVYQEVCSDRSTAQQREYVVRNLSRKDKKILITG